MGFRIQQPLKLDFLKEEIIISYKKEIITRKQEHISVHLGI